MVLQPTHNKGLLRVYLIFRTVLAIVLAGMFLTYSGNILGTFWPDLFLWTSTIYAGLCLLTIVAFPAERLLNSFKRLTASLVADVLAIVLMLHASGGVGSGLGYLLILFVAIGSAFIRGQPGIAYAAMASLLVVAESLYLASVIGFSNQSMFSAGALGVLLFCTAFAIQFLTEKIHSSSREAAAQAAFARHLQRLAQSIVARMRTGIIVVDEAGNIELINHSALNLMDLPKNVDYRGRPLKTISSLEGMIEKWQKDPGSGPPAIQEMRAGKEARVSFSNLELGVTSRTVIYLEDHRVVAQQAQQLKLASLGRLTASIAHEVRNPLGAISHAAQLLAESPDISPADKRLTEIINQHSNRVNQIVESTLTLSRRKEPRADTLNLATWLPRFVNQFRLAQEASIELRISSSRHLVKMDPTHLSQILTNLIDNGLRYSLKTIGEPRVILAVENAENDDTTYLDIIDHGPGIAPESLPHVFDPFYTTDEGGSGLGLYISKELCEINQAGLHYLRTPRNMSCFRIDFSHYQRIF